MAVILELFLLTVLCLANHVAFGSDPNCPVLSITNGNITYNTAAPYHVGDVANATCDMGYTLTGSESRTCEYNSTTFLTTWSGEDANCTIVDCGSVSSIANGMVTYSSDTQYGSTATFTCDDDYELSGESSSECMEDGNWSRETPTCEENGALPLTSSISLICVAVVAIMY